MISSEGSVFALVSRVAAEKSHHVLTRMTIAPRVCLKLLEVLGCVQLHQLPVQERE